MSLKTSLLLLVVLQSCNSLQAPSTRRALFAAIPTAVAAAAVVTVPAAAGALDMDAFMSKELSQSATPKLTDDEGLCRYGAATRQTGEACVRAGMSTKRAGGVDAFGNINRGDFVRCKTFYEDKGSKYEKKVVCE